MRIISVYALLIAVLLNFSCSKNIERVASMENDATIRVNPIRLLPRYPFRPLNICIDSFEQFQLMLGKTEFDVDRVEFTDGTYLSGEPLIAMKYSAVAGRAPSSIFKSLLSVSYLSSMYIQTHWQEVWTLGCRYVDYGNPPFTNLIFNGNQYLINTCFTWGAPPDSKKGLIVKYLYVR